MLPPRQCMMLLCMATACGRIDYDADAPDRPPLGVNMVINPGCESGITNWSDFQGTVDVSPIAHSGSASCKGCVSDGFSINTIDDAEHTIQAAHKGDVYQAEVWVKLLPGSPDRQSTLFVRENLGQPNARVFFTEPVLASEGEWTRLELSHTVFNEDFPTLEIYVDQTGAAGGDCFLADDFSLRRVSP